MSQKILVLGATSGIAEATCRVWAKHGYSLFLVGRSAEKLDAIATDLRIRGAKYVETAVVDLDDTSRHPQLLANAITSLGGLDIAYLTYGIMTDQTQSETDFNAAAQMIYTNLLSPVSLCTWLANYFSKHHRGVIAVLSSVAGERGRKSNYVYGASKAGLTAFLSGLRNRVDREGVTVLTIKPGPVRTAMTAGMKGSQKFADPDKVGQMIVNAIEAKKDEVYVPGMWRAIMFVIRAIPESIFKKLNL